MINPRLRPVVRKVLRAVASTPHFFDHSDSERLSLIITQAYILGQLSAARSQQSGGSRTDNTRRAR